MFAGGHEYLLGDSTRGPYLLNLLLALDQSRVRVLVGRSIEGIVRLLDVLGKQSDGKGDPMAGLDNLVLYVVGGAGVSGPCSAQPLEQVLACWHKTSATENSRQAEHN